MAGLAAGGDDDATDVGTAEKADLGKGMRCWYELPRDRDCFGSGFELDMVLLACLMYAKMFWFCLGSSVVFCGLSGFLVVGEDMM